jgi:hypothetical protein
VTFHPRDARRLELSVAITHVPSTFARFSSHHHTVIRHLDSLATRTRPLNNMVFNKLRKSLGNLRSRYDDTSASPSPPVDIPSNIQSHDQSSIPRNILAFRTITMMLAMLQPNQSTSPEGDAYLASDTDRLSDSARQEVRISDALAHLAIIDHEVVALATEHTTEKMTVIACAIIPEVPSENPPQTQPEGYMGRILSFVFMKNPREDDPPTEPVVTYPKIISASPPKDMGSGTLHDYIQKLDGSS